MHCMNCGKKLRADMDIEYSDEIKEYFCSFGCATTFYFEYMASRPLTKDEKLKIFKAIKKPCSKRMKHGSKINS